MTKPMNVAVIGCGMLARSQHIPNIVSSKKTVLHTCCDLSEEALKECRGKYGSMYTTKDYVEAISNPEVQALCIATHEDLRRPIVELAVKYNKPVYVEKPIAANMNEAYEIQKLINDSGLPFCIGHNRRSSPAMIDAHNIFRDHMENPKLCPWRYDREGDKRPQVEGDGVAAIILPKNWAHD